MPQKEKVNDRDHAALAQTFMHRWIKLCPLQPTALALSKYADSKPMIHKLLDNNPAFKVLNDVIRRASALPLKDNGLVDLLLQLLAKLDRNALSKGLFPVVALLNHSCFPNCVPEFEEFVVGNIGQCVIRTVNDVHVGEELTISYLAETRWHHATHHRRCLLEKLWGFSCTCIRCKPPLNTDHFAHLKSLEDDLLSLQCQASRECSGFHVPHQTTSPASSTASAKLTRDNSRHYLLCTKCGSTCPPTVKAKEQRIAAIVEEFMSLRDKHSGIGVLPDGRVVALDLEGGTYTSPNLPGATNEGEHSTAPLPVTIPTTAKEKLELLRQCYREARELYHPHHTKCYELRILVAEIAEQCCRKWVVGQDSFVYRIIES